MSKLAICMIGTLLVAGCQKQSDGTTAQSPTAPAAAKSTLPPLDANNIVSIAANSKDHSTLVAALQAANYVTSVANPGPLTVFAPTNAAFAKLPKGTVEALCTEPRLPELRDVLKYHVAASVYQAADLKDGQVLGMANGQKTVIRVQDGKITINDAHVLASIRASNGIVHVIDAVLLPPKQ
jgi:uncharacterized surface protein with fasciclin (FAS1) repeats